MKMEIMMLLGLALVGLAAGGISGLIGIGGGIVVVPALVYLFGFDQHSAQGTSLALLLPPIGLLAVLEYHRLKEILKGYAASDPGRRVLDGMQPSLGEGLAHVTGRLDRAGEMQKLVDLQGGPPLEEIPDIAPLLSIADKSGAVLSNLDIYRISQVLRTGRLIRGWLLDRAEMAPLLASDVAPVDTFRDLEKSIFRSFDSSGNVLDEATRRVAPPYFAPAAPATASTASATTPIAAHTPSSIQPKWIDQSASTTRGNALMAAKDLTPLGIQRVALVTTAIHMPRSKQAFESAGFTGIPAPTDYVAQRPFTPGQLAPGAGALVVSHLALREWISRGWYRLLGS